MPLAHFAASWIPFVTPAPIWGLWWLLLFPLVAAIAVVWKAIKLPYMRQVPWEAAKLSGWILGVLLTAALVLGLAVEWVL